MGALECNNNHCIANVVEAMRKNTSSAAVLERGALLVKNIVVFRPDRVEEASGAIITILNGMKEHSDSIGLQKEACNLIWALAALSEDCKAKLLSLDGMEILLGCLDLESVDVQ